MYTRGAQAVGARLGELPQRQAAKVEVEADVVLGDGGAAPLLLVRRRSQGAQQLGQDLLGLLAVVGRDGGLLEARAIGPARRREQRRRRVVRHEGERRAPGRPLGRHVRPAGAGCPSRQRRDRTTAGLRRRASEPHGLRGDDGATIPRPPRPLRCQAGARQVVGVSVQGAPDLLKLFSREGGVGAWRVALLLAADTPIRGSYRLLVQLTFPTVSTF